MPMEIHSLCHVLYFHLLFLESFELSNGAFHNSNCFMHKITVVPSNLNVYYLKVWMSTIIFSSFEAMAT